ncbi:MAG: F0F1 ATP synthase subunit delta [Candidatus Spechtbacterales bacterium]|nr:F0F1 ATP synthase subunit delta [Candidatus Spechtbacterales bacterium]
MALSSKKIARALFSLSEEGIDAEELGNAFWRYADSSNLLYVVPNVIRHLELLNERKKKEKTLFIKTAFPVSEETKKEIERFLHVDENVESDVELDTELIGGFVAKYNNAIYDASIKTQINTLRKKLIS